MFKHIPNILTIFRFLLIPVILYFIFTGNYILGFVFFTISGITDILDGFIARKFNLISNFGKLMDPLADKLTQISVLASLAIVKIIPVWILAIVILKELIMVIGASFLYGKDVVVYSKWYGKLATVLFYFAIVISLITKQFGITGFWVNCGLFIYYIAVISTVFSLIMYVKCLYQDGFIDKSDLNKETQNVIVKNKKKS
jgi:cardiolipin synthase